MIGGNSTCPIDLLNEQIWAQIWAHNYGQGGTSLIHINTCSWLASSSYYYLSLYMSSQNYEEIDHNHDPDLLNESRDETITLFL